MSQKPMFFGHLWRAAFAALLVAGFVGTTGTGCMLRMPPPKQPGPEPLEELGPIEIDWSDPASVVEGFFDAKKRGDWKKAFSCCDYVETLGNTEAAKIRNAWKKEAPQWSVMYRDSMWFIAAAPDIDEDTGMAAVSVVRIDSVGPGAMDTERTGFVELCKLYGTTWKMTVFVVPGEDETR